MVSHEEILRRRHEIDRLRQEKQLMHEYDEQVVRPARKALQAACAEIGHVFGGWQPNGLGGAWRFCQYCDAGEFDGGD